MMNRTNLIRVVNLVSTTSTYLWISSGPAIECTYAAIDIASTTAASFFWKDIVLPRVRRHVQVSPAEICRAYDSRKAQNDALPPFIWSLPLHRWINMAYFCDSHQYCNGRLRISVTRAVGL